LARARAGRRPAARSTDDASSAPARLLARLGAAEPLELAVLGLSLLAAVLMVATEMLPLWEVEVADFSCAVLATDPQQADRCVTFGIEQHRLALALVAVLTLAMGAGAGLGGSQPAAVALCAAGILVLGLGAVDFTAARSTGEIGRDFLDAHAEARAGLWTELLAGALAATAGGLALYAARRAPF
jgi:hypothetical protein